MIVRLKTNTIKTGPSLLLEQNREAIRRIVASHQATNPRVFGSVLHGEDTDESDLDIVVDPTPETTYFDLGAISYELTELLGVPVDVLTPNGLPPSFRERVLKEAAEI